MIQQFQESDLSFQPRECHTQAQMDAITKGDMLNGCSPNIELSRFFVCYRVAVCRAMLNEPQLLLADEPTGNLDQENKQNVVDLLIEQARSLDSTLLMVTHDRSLLGSFERVIDFEELTGAPG